MNPIDLQNADVAGYQIFYFLLIVKALYLICYNYFQSSVIFRVRLFKALKIIYWFIITPLYILWLFIAVRQYIEHDLEKFLLDRVYWKVVTAFAILVIMAIIIFIINKNVVKGTKFLKKKDRNEVKYQTIFKKIRSGLIVLLFIDIAMLLFLNRVVS